VLAVVKERVTTIGIIDGFGNTDACSAIATGNHNGVYISLILCRHLSNAIVQVAVGIMRSFKQAGQQISKSGFASSPITI
jgi:hypothetical protein